MAPAPPPISFPLPDQPWIPALNLQGEPVLCSLRELLLSPGPAALLRLSGLTPEEDAATWRVILALTRRALGPDPQGAPARMQRWMTSGTIPEEDRVLIGAYIDRWATRLDLFGATPFMQVGDLQETGTQLASARTFSRVDPINRLSLSLATQHNTALVFQLDMRTTERLDRAPLTPAQAVTRLLGFQGFAPGGLIQRTITSAQNGASLGSWVGMPIGANLLESLALALAGIRWNDADLPSWEWDPLTEAGLRETLGRKAQHWPLPAGPCALYTWPGRALRLRPAVTDSGEVLISEVLHDVGQPVARGEAAQLAVALADPWRIPGAVRDVPLRPWQVQALTAGYGKKGDLRPGPAAAAQLLYDLGPVHPALHAAEDLFGEDLFADLDSGHAADQVAIEVPDAAYGPAPRLLNVEFVGLLTSQSKVLASWRVSGALPGVPLDSTAEVLLSLKHAWDATAALSLRLWRMHREVGRVTGLEGRGKYQLRSSSGAAYDASLERRLQTLTHALAAGLDPREATNMWSRSVRRLSRRTLDRLTQEWSTSPRLLDAAAQFEGAFMTEVSRYTYDR
ncbi:type I-E CRISPR-associated protein Cse1/CasA [Deinococcus soli (ex Cha et al. 2016)]|uniref:Uncharacterized protein n=2 Tax=Deinococcus soli (ex Cha et al. 2016) TaxID=1309411 RepID=A0ACC6KH13_9DEIO|nr:type I-E CRISPR-associated protein Cse1/CasA [Deinococcus soli (ex Cha et al. 2016)]MDR6218925.1 hypothetical protein [Deinococcus soli (ex Cha et al. 2016)]MDR6328722.1 hypothetical protein [Deinococcus soli (ex Cha et al. 2016)]MDR6751791.1 hypothetical protein [Deinococcus soli (ex Cha et al. 2016)]